jgi:HTH-type transcriptional regulator/antitoxin HigA
MSPIHVLHTEADYEAALAEYERYFDDEPAEGSAEADRFELLGLVIAKYEEEHAPIPAAAPLDVLRFAMEQQGHAQSDLAALLGSRSRASEILNGRRDLTLAQIRTLAKAWRIPANLLVGELEAA